MSRCPPRPARDCRLFAVGRGGLLIQACAPWVLGSHGWSGGAATVGARRRSGASPATTAPNGPVPARPWTRPRRFRNSEEGPELFAPAPPPVALLSARAGRRPP